MKKLPIFLPAIFVLIFALLIMALPISYADSPGDSGKLGHSTGKEVKRLKNTGKGMPSISGPFDDTVNMEYLGQLTNAELGVTRLAEGYGAGYLSDIWGWTSPAGEEYAIVGTTAGVAFVRITDPTNPEFLGRIPTTDPDTFLNFWWDIKTFNNHAYFTTEVTDAGLTIFELTQLDNLAEAPSDKTLSATANYAGNGYEAAHNISINEDTGFAYLTGVTQAGLTTTDLVILDLNADPLAPVQVGTIEGMDTHDAQVVTYHGPHTEYERKEIAFVFNGIDLNIGIYDVTNKGDIKVLSETSYPGASYTHQGWLTEDHKFLLVGDEEDELFGISDPQNPDLPDTARTYIFDVQDLTAPQLIGTFDSPAASIDHNLFIKGNRVYQAHYTAGIRVLEITETGTGITLSEVAHMDTEPRLPNGNMSYNINIFVGPWGIYPYFDSGTIIASDGLNGLIISRLSE